MTAAATPRLELRQQQSLVMTQQLQQSIKLLQLSSMELQEYIAEELERNPLLKEDGPEESNSRGDESDSQPAPSAERESPLDTNAEDNWSSGEWQQPIGKGGRGGHDELTENLIDQTANALPSLRDHLLEHLFFSTDEVADRLIGRHLIDLVDEAGYLPPEYTDIATTLQCDLAEVERMVVVLQRCGPPGLCARHLAECLALQLREKDRLDPAMQALLEHLDLLGKSEFDKLARLCGVDRDDLRDMVAEIKALNPKPGMQFSHESAGVVEPDVMVRRRPQGWQIELNPRALPRVLLNQSYYTELSERSRSKEDKKYLSEQWATASWLVKALDQRARTLLKVAEEIVSQQESFLKHGIRYLKPLTLREVAEKVEMHESTISRVTTQKYMLTPLGTFELKYFFTSAVQNAMGGIEFSSKSVQFMIQEMIAEETAEAVLSDDAIAEKLKEQGVDVARRTVAKYRDILHIPSSADRRRLKRSAL